MTESTQNRLIAGCGYLGRRVAEAWRHRGYTTHAITRSEGRAAEFRAAGLNPIQLDLSAPSDDILLPPSDVVLWAVGFDRSAGVPREKIWLDGLQWFTKHLPKAPQRFIYVSSTSVYGALDGEIVNESTATAPNSEGGTCCLKAEELLRELCAELHPESQVVALRMAGIYGPNRLLRRVSDLHEQKPVPGNPDHWLNLIHVDDAVKMVNYVADSARVPAVINVVNRGTLTRRQYYSTLAELASAPPPVFQSPEECVAAGSRGGNKRVTSEHGVELDTGFEFDDVLTGLRDAVVRSSV